MQRAKWPRRLLLRTRSSSPACNLMRQVHSALCTLWGTHSRYSRLMFSPGPHRATYDRQAHKHSILARQAVQTAQATLNLCFTAPGNLQVEKTKQEIRDRLDPKVLAFLQKRAAQRQSQKEQPNPVAASSMVSPSPAVCFAIAIALCSGGSIVLQRLILL